MSRTTKAIIVGVYVAMAILLTLGLAAAMSK